MKVLTAYTLEIDDVDAAVSQILDQLQLDSSLLKNAVGILTCYCEFIETGVVEALCERLPFDVIGCTTFTSSTNGCFDLMQLCIQVFTADDVSFSTALTTPLTDSDTLGSKIQDAYLRAAKQLPERPKIVLPFFPMSSYLGGQLMMDHLDSVCDGVPIFGTVACDHNPDFSGSCVVYHGRAEKSAACMLLMSGNVNPQFYTTVVSPENMQPHRGIITKSKDNIIYEVNGIPLTSYLESLGLSWADGNEGLASVPFLVDYNDGSEPIARTTYQMLDDGSISFGGRMPEGATLAMGTFDYNEVLATSKGLVQKIVDMESSCGLLISACLARCLVLSANSLDELEAVDQVIGDRLPYQMLYSGGECCPVRQQDGTYINRFHNCTITVCAF